MKLNKAENTFTMQPMLHLLLQQLQAIKNEQ